MKKYIQIERSGSTQTSYRPTPLLVVQTLETLANEGGEITERPDLVECVNIPGRAVQHVMQIVSSAGICAGTTGRFFAEVTSEDTTDL
jgi:hypothetical protein